MSEGKRLWGDWGMSVIPLIPGEKKPAVEMAPYFTRPPYQHEIESWDLTHYGIICGAVSGICVVDLDGERGREILEERGLNEELTPTVYTPRGRHMYFQYAPGITNGVAVLGKGIDIRSDRGFVVGPGTPGYSWAYGMSIDDIELALAPTWLRGLKDKNQQENGNHTPSNLPRMFTDKKIKEGNRNNVLTSWFGTLLKRMRPEMAYTALWHVNLEYFDPPIGRQEFDKTYNSIVDRESKSDR